MGVAERSGILQRKARSGREEHLARVMSPQRALRLALARAAEETFGLALSVSSIEGVVAGQEAVVACAEAEWLILLLDGPGGAIGTMALDRAVLTALIEMQTVGRVIARPPEARQPTQTDAAMVAPLIDATLAGLAANLAANLADGGGDGWAVGYRFGAMIDGPRLLALALEAAEFRLFRLQAELDGGARQGEIVLALPALLPDAARCDGEGHAEGEPAATACDVRLQQGALMEAEARMTAVLHRIRLPLAAVATWRPGDTIGVPRQALAQTRLEAGSGRSGIACRLGQKNGFRAVRIAGVPEMQTDRSAGWGGPESDVDRQDREHGEGGTAGQVMPPRVPEERFLPAGADRPAATGAEEGSVGPSDGLGDDLSDLPDLALDE